MEYIHVFPGAAELYANVYRTKDNEYTQATIKLQNWSFKRKFTITVDLEYFILNCFDSRQ